METGFKREKVEDINRIEALYKEGKISRTSYWRARRRGYIWLNWHTPQKLSDYVLSKREQYDFYRYCTAVAKNFVFIHQRYFLDNKIFNNLVRDIAHDLFLYVISRQPVNFKQAKARIKSALLSLSQKPMWYGKYLSFPIRKKEGQAGNSLSLTEYMEEYSTAYQSTML